MVKHRFTTYTISQKKIMPPTLSSTWTRHKAVLTFRRRIKFFFVDTHMIQTSDHIPFIDSKEIRLRYTKNISEIFCSRFFKIQNLFRYRQRILCNPPNTRRYAFNFDQ